MFVRSILAACLMVGATTAAIADQTACFKGYANATTNLKTDIRRTYEYDYLFTVHCEKNGDLKQSSRNTDLTVVTQYWWAEGHDDQKKSEQRMQEFCKQHLGERVALGEQYMQAKEVVTDALRLLNQCIALAQNGVDVSHEFQEARSVIVRFDFNPAKTKMSLRSVAYDMNVANCRTTALEANGKPVLINSKMKETEITKPFSVTCERTAVTNVKGNQKFNRFVLGVDTLWGTYSVAMPTEEMLGFDLANQNKIRYETVAGERDKLVDLMKHANVQFHHVRIGERPLGGYWEHWGCGTDAVKTMAKVCKDKQVVHKRLQGHGGNKCGYEYYVYGCVNHGIEVTEVAATK